MSCTVTCYTLQSYFRSYCENSLGECKGLNAGPDTHDRYRQVLESVLREEGGGTSQPSCGTPICSLLCLRAVPQVGDNNLQQTISLSYGQELPPAGFQASLKNCSVFGHWDVSDKDISGSLKAESRGSARPAFPPGTNQGSWVAAAASRWARACQCAIWPAHTPGSPAWTPGGWGDDLSRWPPCLPSSPPSLYGLLGPRKCWAESGGGGCREGWAGGKAGWMSQGQHLYWPQCKNLWLELDHNAGKREGVGKGTHKWKWTQTEPTKGSVGVRLAAEAQKERGKQVRNRNNWKLWGTKVG